MSYPKVSKVLISLFAALVIFVAPLRSHAVMAVVDVRAIVQMTQQLQVLRQQLQAARDQLNQAREQFEAMTGGRGMERLLSETVRNYLPPNWAELEAVIRGLNSRFSALANQVESIVTANAMLTLGQLNNLPAEVRTLIDAERRAVALRQAISREALANVGQRFQSLQQLINAIPTAGDPKAILDLQARIQAEHSMLINEQTKLQMLDRLAQAEEQARRQREWEHTVAASGRFATRFQPTP